MQLSQGNHLFHTMCNALNHPRDCTCGWGGDGHKGRKTGTTKTSKFYSNPKKASKISLLLQRIENLSISDGKTFNSTCPVCQKPCRVVK